MIGSLAKELPDGAVLAVSNHPLNDLYRDNGAINAATRAHSDRVVLLPGSDVAGATTAALVQRCDALIVGNSKSWSLAVAAGKPIVRLSDFRLGDWVNAYTSLDDLIEDLENGCPRVADPALTRRWFAWHLYDTVFDPADRALTAADMLARVHDPVDPARWLRGFARAHLQATGAAA